MPIPKLGWQLPANCAVVQDVNGITTLAVCEAPPETRLDKVVVTLPSIALSIVAVVLSIRTFVYSRSKDQAARDQSVQDDFWVRKVVAPISIEPFLRYVNELSGALPTAARATDAEIQQYWVDQVEKMEQFTIAFRTLALIEPTLDAAVAEKLGELEDVLASYCGELRLHLSAGAPAPDRSATVRQFTALSLAAMKLIQLHQASMGRKS